MHTSEGHSSWNPQRLDVRSFARAGGHLQIDTPMKRFERLLEDQMASDAIASPPIVHWQAQGSERTDAQGGAPAIWLRLQATAAVSLQCQRCLGPVEVPLEVDRWFRFVADEATAELQDDESEEDVLALEPVMSLYELLEDELLMALPIVPMHETCPVPVLMQAADASGSREDGAHRPDHPFAALAKLKK